MMVTIYATLDLAQTLAGVLRERELLDAAFVLGMLLVGATIATQALKTRLGGVEIAIGLGIGTLYAIIFLRMAIPEERTHLIEYGIVSVFIYGALLERVSNGRRVTIPAALAVGLTALLGWIDEGIQWLLPNRVYDIEDVVFNFLAGVIAVTASAILTQARYHLQSRKSKH